MRAETTTYYRHIRPHQAKHSQGVTPRRQSLLYCSPGTLIKWDEGFSQTARAASQDSARGGHWHSQASTAGSTAQQAGHTREFQAQFFWSKKFERISLGFHTRTLTNFMSAAAALLWPFGDVRTMRIENCFDEYEKVWPWLTQEDVQAKVSSGDHGINLNIVRTIASSLDYEEWYYACVANDHGDPRHDDDDEDEDDDSTSCLSDPTKLLMETLAFQKKDPDSGNLAKILFYPRTNVVAVAAFQHSRNENLVELAPHPKVARAENFYVNYLGINPATPENSDCTKADALFNPHSKKYFLLYKDVTSPAIWQAILTSPLEAKLPMKLPPPMPPMSSTTSAAMKKIPKEDESAITIQPKAVFARKCWIIGRWQKPTKKLRDGKGGDDDDQSFGVAVSGPSLTEVIFDMSVRWQHMALATGLPMNDKVMSGIIQVCQLMETTLFLNGPASLARTRHYCGSVCAILNLLLQIGKDHHGVIGFALAKRHWLVREGRTPYLTMFGGGNCERFDGFKAAGYGDHLERLRDAIVALPAPIRWEIITFFFERTSSNPALKTMLDSDFKPMFGTHYQLLKGASIDYSRLFAGDGSGKQYCYRYGLFRIAGEGDHDDDDDDDTDASTVATMDSYSDDTDNNEDDDEGAMGEADDEQQGVTAEDNEDDEGMMEEEEQVEDDDGIEELEDDKDIMEASIDKGSAAEGADDNGIKEEEELVMLVVADESDIFAATGIPIEDKEEKLPDSDHHHHAAECNDKKETKELVQPDDSIDEED